jgi:hypothetical protein
MPKFASVRFKKGNKVRFRKEGQHELPLHEGEFEVVAVKAIPDSDHDYMGIRPQYVTIPLKGRKMQFSADYFEHVPKKP